MYATNTKNYWTSIKMLNDHCPDCHHLLGMHFDLYDKHTTALEVSEAEPCKCTQWVTTNIERYGGDDVKGGNHHWRFIDHRCQCNYTVEKHWLNEKHDLH